MNRINYKKTIIDIFLIAFLILFPHFAHLPFYSYAIICFALIIVYLKRQNKTLGDLGFKFKGLTIHTFIVGVLSSIIWMFFIKFLYFPFINHFFEDYLRDYTQYGFIKNYNSPQK